MCDIGAPGVGALAKEIRAKITDPTIRRHARQIITLQRREILQIRRRLRQQGLSKSEDRHDDTLFQPG